MGAGNVLTLNFNINQSVTNVKVAVNGAQVPVNGSGSGPFTISYSVTGNETSPLPVVITFANLSGQTGQASFWIGNPTATAASPNTTTALNCPAGYTCASTPGTTASTASTAAASSGAQTFTGYLYSGMTKLGVADLQVTALQERLKADGIYSGPVTGYFGSETKAAVEAYQKKHGLSPIGVVGPSTRALLNKGI